MLRRFFLLSVCLLPAMSVADTWTAETDFTGDYAADVPQEKDKVVLSVKPYQESTSAAALEDSRDEWDVTVFDVDDPKRVVEKMQMGLPEGRFRPYTPSGLVAEKNADSVDCVEKKSLILCHAKPGTNFPSEHFTTRTGYFLIVWNVGLIGLIKLSGP